LPWQNGGAHGTVTTMTLGDNRLTGHATAQASGPPAQLLSGGLRAMTDALERLGYDVDRLLAMAGLARSAVQDPDALIPCAAYGVVLCAAQQEHRIVNLPLRMAVVTPIGAFPLLDYLVVTCDSVGQGMKQLARYFRLVDNPVTLQIHDDEEPVRVSLDSPVLTFSLEYTASMMVHHFREETDDRFSPVALSFAHRLEDVDEYSRVLRCPVQTGASWNGLTLSRQTWNLSLRRRDPILHGVLARHAEDLTGRETGGGVIAELRRLLASRLANGDTGIQSVARQLATTPRTLQRRLAAEGLSYQEVLDSTRRAMAEQHLAEQRLSIAEVSYLLGYSEPAAFHRAFKRWSGATPQGFRQRQHAVSAG
jgi:AraC-like DNA-binding protein